MNPATTAPTTATGDGTVSGGAAPPPAPSALRQRLARLPAVTDVALLPIWVVVIIGFSIAAPDTFPTWQTARTVASDEAITAILALALLLPLAAGAFDLSIGGTMGVSIVLVAYFQSHLSIPPAPAIILTLLCGLLIGAFNAFVIVRLRVDSFIATLGMSSILLAAVQWISGGEQIVEGIPTSFTNLGSTQLLGIPLPFYYMLVIAAVLWYVMGYRQTGRFLYATGSNPDAARLAGVRTDRLTVIALLTSSTVASLGGIIFCAKIGSASLDAGPPYLLPAFAAVFLGATQFKARHVNVIGTLIAVYVLATGVKGLQLVGSAFWVNDLFNGLAVIIAVAFAVRATRRKKV